MQQKKGTVQMFLLLIWIGFFQINTFLLEDIEKNLEEYKKAIALRDKIAEAKKYFSGQKNVTIWL